MRHTLPILAAGALVALAVALHARGAPPHAVASSALFSFALLAFRDPVG